MDDYLKQAYEILNNDYLTVDPERCVGAQALATMGILQQLTRIADMMEDDRKPRSMLREYG